MTIESSRLSGFHSLNRLERFEKLKKLTAIDEQAGEKFLNASEAQGELANDMIENAIGTMNIPLGVATNLIVDGEDVLVPMATEESSVIAAVCNGARQCRRTGGVKTSTTGSLMIAQVQITGLSNPFATKILINEHLEEIGEICNALDPVLVKLGGGFRSIEMHVLDTTEPMLILHLIIDTRDAMGANTVNTMAEAIAPYIEKWTGGTVGLRILSNLADKRLVRVRAVWTPEDIGGENVRDAMVKAAEFAVADPYRAATHNKGIMNGISAVALATGNDTRAIESGAHAYASKTGRYQSMTCWEVGNDGNLHGSLEIPLAMGIVGGATKIHPTAQMAIKIMDISSADRLIRIAGAVGLIQNFSAMKALATEGIQRGHMSLHAKNVALAVGATADEVEELTKRMIQSKSVREDSALKILSEIRASV